MVSDHLDTLKEQYTDKYVVVDAARPELARFRDVVGQVKTVNMSGRALVEFLDYHVNIGWYDIDPSFLKLVDKPAPKPKEPEAKKAAPAKPAAAAPAKPPAAAKAAPAAGGKKSTADILAAARSGQAAAPAKAAKPPAEEPPAEVAAKPEQAAEEPVVEKAPAPAKAAKATEKVDRSKMTVDDMLAWCRAHDAK